MDMSMTTCGLLAVIVVSASCGTEPSTSTLIAKVTTATSGASTLDPPIPPAAPAATPAVARARVTAALVAGAKQVGYYDMTTASGQPYQVTPITAAGATAIDITDPSSQQLAHLNVLWVNNPDNGGYSSPYVARLTDIAAAVQAGMVLVIHDRFVSGAAGILPGGDGFSVNRDFTESADINLRDTSTPITVGLTDASLDGGNASSHGFTLASTLPETAKLALTATTPSHIVTFCYPVGLGAVIYSTIPLDFYLQNQGNSQLNTNMDTIYAPNVVTYAIAGACSQQVVISGPRPTPN
jgi:hypothetical protein